MLWACKVRSDPYGSWCRWVCHCHVSGERQWLSSSEARSPRPPTRGQGNALALGSWPVNACPGMGRSPCGDQVRAGSEPPVSALRWPVGKTMSVSEEECGLERHGSLLGGKEPGCSRVSRGKLSLGSACSQAGLHLDLVRSGLWNGGTVQTSRPRMLSAQTHGDSQIKRAEMSRPRAPRAGSKVNTRAGPAGEPGASCVFASETPCVLYAEQAPAHEALRARLQTDGAAAVGSSGASRAEFLCFSELRPGRGSWGSRSRPPGSGVSAGKEVSPFTAFARVCIRLAPGQLGRERVGPASGPLLPELAAAGWRPHWKWDWALRGSWLSTGSSSPSSNSQRPPHHARSFVGRLRGLPPAAAFLGCSDPATLAFSLFLPIKSDRKQGWVRPWRNWDPSALLAGM